MRWLPLSLRLAARRLARAPLFTLTAAITLTLGIGANTAVFSVVRGVLLRPLPFPSPERLVRLWGTQPERDVMRGNVSPLDFLDWAEEARTLTTLAAWTTPELPLTGEGEPERVPVAQATSSLWTLTGARAAVGRLYTTAEDRPGAARVAVLAYALWERRYGGDPAILGRTVRVAGDAYRVVGVAEPGFTGPVDGEGQAPALWVPLRIDPTTMGGVATGSPRPAGSRRG